MLMALGRGAPGGERLISLAVGGAVARSTRSDHLGGGAELLLPLERVAARAALLAPVGVLGELVELDLLLLHLGEADVGAEGRLVAARLAREAAVGVALGAVEVALEGVEVGVRAGRLRVPRKEDLLLAVEAPDAVPLRKASGGTAGAAAAAAGAAAAAPPASRLARYSAKDSALWMACLPFGSFGSYTVGSGSRVASPPNLERPWSPWSPEPGPPPMVILDCLSLDGITGAMKAEVSATNMARTRKRNMVVLRSRKKSAQKWARERRGEREATKAWRACWCGR